MQAAPDIGWEILRATAAPPDASRVEVYRGTLTASELGDIARAKTSNALDALRVPITAFSFDGATAVASEQPLDEGDYTIALRGVAEHALFHVIPAADPPVLRRAWPPLDVPASAGALVYCGDSAAPAASTATALEPAGVTGAFVSPLVDGSRCVRFRADIEGVDGVVVPPPLLTLGDRAFRLGPGSLLLSTGTPVDVVACHAGEAPIGPGCAKIMDDRLEVRTPVVPVGWSIGGLSGGAAFLASRDAKRVVVHGLEPAHAFQLTVLTLDTTGAIAAAKFSGVTLPTLPHLVITEVYAHPLGPRPQQQWVELFNDGAATVSTKGLTLLVGGVPSPLPEVEIGKGRYALIVTPPYQMDDGIDVAPPVDCPLVRTAKLGKKALALTGQTLELLGADGTPLSAFPAIPAHKAGVSIARSDPEAADDDPASFAASPGPATPCAPNVAAM